VVDGLAVHHAQVRRFDSLEGGFGLGADGLPLIARSVDEGVRSRLTMQSASGDARAPPLPSPWRSHRSATTLTGCARFVVDAYCFSNRGLLSLEGLSAPGTSPVLCPRLRLRGDAGALSDRSAPLRSHGEALASLGGFALALSAAGTASPQGRVSFWLPLGARPLRRPHRAAGSRKMPPSKALVGSARARVRSARPKAAQCPLSEASSADWGISAQSASPTGGHFPPLRRMCPAALRSVHVGAGCLG
jgi:hypothetical protein